MPNQTPKSENFFIAKMSIFDIDRNKWLRNGEPFDDHMGCRLTRLEFLKVKIYFKGYNKIDNRDNKLKFQKLDYHSGGPGFVVSSEGFRRLGKKLAEDYYGCANTGVDDINDCLRQLGTKMGVSIDKKGRQRWLCLNIMHFFMGAFPDWLFQYSSHPFRKVLKLSDFNLKYIILF